MPNPEALPVTNTIVLNDFEEQTAAFQAVHSVFGEDHYLVNPVFGKDAVLFNALRSEQAMEDKDETASVNFDLDGQAGRDLLYALRATSRNPASHYQLISGMILGKPSAHRQAAAAARELHGIPVTDNVLKDFSLSYQQVHGGGEYTESADHGVAARKVGLGFRALGVLGHRLRQQFVLSEADKALDATGVYKQPFAEKKSQSRSHHYSKRLLHGLGRIAAIH